MKNYYQQGDVLLKEIDKKAIKGVEVKDDNVIKSASNQHSLGNGNYAIYKDNDDVYLEIKSQTEVLHQEHDKLVIPTGFYKVVTVLEYDHFLEESKEVID